MKSETNLVTLCRQLNKKDIAYSSRFFYFYKQPVCANRFESQPNIFNLNK